MPNRSVSEEFPSNLDSALDEFFGLDGKRLHTEWGEKTAIGLADLLYREGPENAAEVILGSKSSINTAWGRKSREGLVASLKNIFDDIQNKNPVKDASMQKEALRLRPLGPNRNEVEIGDWLVLFSYQTPVAAVSQTSGDAIRTDKRWSNTTSRHVKQWLGGIEAKTVPQDTLEKLINTGKLEEEAPAEPTKKKYGPGPSVSTYTNPSDFREGLREKVMEKPVMGTKRVGQRGADDWEEDRGFSVAFSFYFSDDADDAVVDGDTSAEVLLDNAKKEAEKLFGMPIDVHSSDNQLYLLDGEFTHWVTALRSISKKLDDGRVRLSNGVVLTNFRAIRGHFGRPAEMVDFENWFESFGASVHKTTAASLPDLFNSKYVKWMQQEAALLAANLGAYTSEVDASALLDQAVQKLVATVQTAVQEEVEKVINEARENIVEAMMDDLEAKNRGIVPAAPVAGPPEIPAEFEEQPVPMAKAKRRVGKRPFDRNAITTNYEDMAADDSLYAALVAANIKVDKHESDLYFPVTEESTEILSRFTQEHLIAEKFRNRDGTLWYDVPFAFTPYWKEKQKTLAKARRTLAQKEETEVARGMAEKGYKYIMIDQSGEIEPLYAKTSQMAAELMREDYPDKKFDVQPIDKFLGGEKTHLDSAVEKIGQMKVGPDLEAVRSNELGVCVGCGVAGVTSDRSEDAVLLCANEYGELVCEDCAERAKKY